jgi:hypothetical protein
VVFALSFAGPAFGQQPAGGWSYPAFTQPAVDPIPPPANPQPPAPLAEVPRPNGYPNYVPDPGVRAEELPPLPDEAGQQHWVSVNLCVLQPFVGRIAVKVWPRANNSLWVEAYAGSVLFDLMYGFGVRVQHTALEFGRGDRLMVSPGVGVHIIPQWSVHQHHARSWEPNYPYRNSLTFLYGDVDISWLHDFAPHFGFELGMKLGLAGRISGEVGRRYPRSFMFGSNVYPILAFYSGFRF